MDTNNINYNDINTNFGATNSYSSGTKCIDQLKKENIESQKKGLPFIMASVVIWMIIFFLQLGNRAIYTTNLYTFISSCLLMPLAYLFSKIVKADIFEKTENPISKLGFLCTLNQMLYILIVMWAYNQKPEAMTMLYAMVFGAHLLPFGWVYNSRAYIVVSIAETVGALILGVCFGNGVTAVFIALMEVALVVFLFLEKRQSTEQTPEIAHLNDPGDAENA